MDAMGSWWVSGAVVQRRAFWSIVLPWERWVPGGFLGSSAWKGLRTVLLPWMRWVLGGSLEL